MLEIDWVKVALSLLTYKIRKESRCYFEIGVLQGVFGIRAGYSGDCVNESLDYATTGAGCLKELSYWLNVTWH